MDGRGGPVCESKMVSAASPTLLLIQLLAIIVVGKPMPSPKRLGGRELVSRAPKCAKLGENWRNPMQENPNLMVERTLYEADYGSPKP